MKKSLVASLILLFMPSAQAAIFNFSYTSNLNGTLAGQISGTLQADNNTVIVNSILDFASLAGIPAPGLPYLASTDFFNFGTSGLSPILTLDGSYMDFFASSSPSGSTHSFTFNANNITAQTFGAGGAPFYGTGGFFGGSFGGGFAEVFNASNWQLSAANASVPEASTTALLGIGLLMVFGAYQKARSPSGKKLG